jgi:flagellar biosynthetic protein FliP
MKSLKKLISFYCAVFSILMCFSSLALAAGSGIGTISELQNFLSGPSFSGRIIQIFLLIGVLGIAPSLLIMVTSFVRISVVLSIVRTALGLQQSPPTQVLNCLALFLTFFIMSSSFKQSYDQGLKPLIAQTLSEEEAIPLIIEPFKKFMLANTRSKDLDLFSGIAQIEITNDSIENLPLEVVIPSFMISELRRGFEIGFLLFLPFLIIDIVVASLLMSMGMMMMPPVMVSLPFKVIFFVLIDGWYLLAGSLIKSFVS